MKQLRIPIKGIKRNSPQGTEDGACDDLINMRFINNAWRPIAPKVKLHDENTYDLQRIHVIDGVDIGNWIGYLELTEAIDYFDPSDGSVTQAVMTLNATETLNDILFLKRLMIVVTDENAYKFYYKDSTYVPINLTGIEDDFGVTLSFDALFTTTVTDTGSDAEELLGKYYKLINEGSSAGYNYGGFFYRVALKMFDGNYIMHTSPTYYQFATHSTLLSKAAGVFTLALSAASTSILARYTQISDTEYDAIKDLIQSIVVFGSKVEPLYDIDEDTITDANLTTLVPLDGDSVLLKEQSLIGINPDFKKMGDSIAWYQIGEISLSKLVLDAGSQTDDLLLTGTNGSADITGTGGLTRTATFDVTLSTTAANFVGSYAGDYLALGITLTKQGDTLKFSKIDGTYVSPVITTNAPSPPGDLSGSVTTVVVPATPGEYTEDIEVDFNGYYQNYATRRKLPVDDFTHHELTGNASYIYNDRLMFGDTVQTLATPYINTFRPQTNAVLPTGTYNYREMVTGKIEIVLGTFDEKVITQDVELDLYENIADPLDIAVFFPNLISYPDSRAKEIIVHIEYLGVFYELFRENLQKSSLHNFSYFVNPDFDKEDVDSATSDPRRIDTNFNSYPIQFAYTDLSASTLLDEDNVITDNNRWAVSEVNNPIIFANENSNQVGIGTIIAFGTNTERIGTSQFGQFPIIIFMSTGRWIAELGTGDIYVTRIVPIDRDVIRDKDAKLDLAFGVVYITAEGLKIAQAKEVVVISDMVDGSPDLNFIDNTDFIYFANNENTVQMIDYLDKVEFLTYLEDATLGYNKNFENSELIIANPNYYYAYVYDITSKTWYKFAEKISQFIPSYPNLYAMSEKRSGIVAPYVLTKRILNISAEEAGNTQCMIVTRALTMGMEDVFKKLHRTFIRGYFTTKTDTYAAAYIFGSDNLKDWKFITGNDMNTTEFKDVWITHTKGSSRYFIVVFAAELSVGTGIINRFNSIDCMFQEKRNLKLR